MEKIAAYKKRKYNDIQETKSTHTIIHASGEIKPTFIDQIMSESDTGYTLEDIIATKYRDKRNASPQEVFAFRDKLIPSWNNLFLFKTLYHEII